MRLSCYWSWISSSHCGSPRGSADYFDNVLTKFVISNRTDPLKTDINLFFTITNCRIAGSRSLTSRMNFKFMCLSVSWQRKLANERAWISAVNVKRKIEFETTEHGPSRLTSSTWSRTHISLCLMLGHGRSELKISCYLHTKLFQVDNNSFRCKYICILPRAWYQGIAPGFLYLPVWDGSPPLKTFSSHKKGLSCQVFQNNSPMLACTF